MKTRVLITMMLGGLVAAVGGDVRSAQAFPEPILCPVAHFNGEQEMIDCFDDPDPFPPPPPPGPACTSDGAPGASCPVALPSPALDWMVECKASENTSRCGTGLPTSVCQDNNDRALARGLVTEAAHCWLEANGQCAINMDGVGGILSICPVGCFEENSAILTVNEDGASEWLAAKVISAEHKLYSLGSDSLLSFPALTSRSIERMSIGPEERALYVFVMSNGHKLRVTSHHAMVLSDGRIVEAEKVTEGDAFIGVDGTEVSIETIAREHTSADVYNFSVAVDTPKEHVIAAEGVLIGDLAWQSTLADEMGSINLRR